MGRKVRKQILKTGTIRDSKGNSHEFSRKRLNAIADLYDPTHREATLQFGHNPHSSSPSAGFVQSLTVEGDGLYATIELNAIGETAIKEQLYKTVSPRIETNGYLSHVALLGTAQPAVPGMENFEFNASASGGITFELAEKASDFFKEGDMPISEEERRKLEKEADAKAEEKYSTKIAELEKAKETSALELKKEKEKGVEFSKEAEATRVKTLKDDASGFCKKAVEDGKILPAQSETLEAIMLSLAEQPEDSAIELSKGDSTESVSPLALLKRFIESSGKQIDLSKQSSSGDGDPGIELSAEQEVINNQLGISKEDFQKVHGGDQG